MRQTAFRKFILVFAFIFAAGIVIGSVATSLPGRKQQTASETTRTLATPEKATTTTKAASVLANGETILQGKCTICHDLEKVQNSRKSESEWSATIDRMVSKGTQVSAEEKEVLVKFLTQNYGPSGETDRIAAAATVSQAENAGQTLAQAVTTTTAPVTTPTDPLAGGQTTSTTVAQESVTPAEQAETGVETIYYLLSGSFMIGSGLCVRRRPRKPR